MRIFVSVVSYRDPLLHHTIKSLLENKSERHKVTIGVFEQTSFEESLENLHKELLLDKNIKYKRIDPQHSEGVGWARHINSLQLEDEDFYYQIDSHMLFDKHWDRNLVNNYRMGVEKKDSNKIIITANCKNYDLNANNEPEKIPVHAITCEAKYFAFRKDMYLFGHGDWVDARKDLTPAIHIFAGNFFTHSDWVRNVGVDPFMFFEGEEQLLSIKSFAAGYHLFHPTSIECYHYNRTGEYITKQRVNPVVSQEVISKRQTKAREHFLAVLDNLDEDMLERFRKYSGVDYINRKLEKRAITKGILPVPGEDRDWEIEDRID